MEAAGNQTIERDGKKIARKRVVASLAWELLTTGETVLPNNQTLKLAPQDWIGLYKWIYQHIDGPPKTELDLTSGGEKITEIGVRLVDYRIGITPSETGSSGDSGAPGKNKSPVDGTKVG